jgi:hypothetical protein
MSRTENLRVKNASQPITENREPTQDLLFGPLAYRILRGLPADEQTVRQVVDMALQGLEPRGD